MRSQQAFEELAILDNLTNAFRPIEELFKIMDSCSTEIYGELIRSHAEVGAILCKNFRAILEQTFKETKEQNNV